MWDRRPNLTYEAESLVTSAILRKRRSASRGLRSLTHTGRDNRKFGSGPLRETFPDYGLVASKRKISFPLVPDSPPRHSTHHTTSLRI